MIESGFTLHTDLFESITPRADFINPRCFGEDFAAWLRERLVEKGIHPEEPIQEDFGWVLLVPFEGHTFTIAIGVMDESIGASPAEWRVGVAFEKGLNGFRSWFRKPPAHELSRLAGVLEQVLAAEPRFQGLAPA